jgi:hypothetical protein
MKVAKHRFLKEPHSVTSQTTALFLVTATKTTNLINYESFGKEHQAICGRKPTP